MSEKKNYKMKAITITFNPVEYETLNGIKAQFDASCPGYDFAISSVCKICCVEGMEIKAKIYGVKFSGKKEANVPKKT